MKTTTMLKRAIISLAVSAAAISAFTVTANAFELEQHTEDEIRQAYNNMYFDIHDNVDYTEEYTDEAPFSAGDISDEDRQNTLNALNFVRYVAGLPADVTDKDNYNVLAQNASYVGYMRKNIDHYPGRPGNLYSDDASYNADADRIFALGYSGSGSSNLSNGDFTPAESVVSYMNDTDGNNISAMGHRRWILNPRMKYTGVGAVDRFSAIYSVDKSRTDSFTGDYIAWPAAGSVPFELIDGKDYRVNGYAFTVTLGEDYMFPELGKVEVTVTTNTGISKNFKDYNGEMSSFFGINNQLCGYYTPDQDGQSKGKTIIFNPGYIPADSEINVKITGIYKKDGKEAPIEYTVKYFDLLNKDDYAPGYAQEQYTINAGRSIYINCYNHPLRSTGYSVYTEPTINTLKNTEGVSVFKIDSQMFIRSEKEMTIKLRIVDSNWYWVNSAASRPRANLEFLHKHNYEWIIDEEPTDDQPGIKHQECTECGTKKPSKLIPARSMEAAEVTLNDKLAITTQDEDTLAVRPVVSVSSSNTTLVKDKDFTVSYVEDHESGVVRVILQGINSYVGTKVVEHPLINISSDDFTVKITNGSNKKYQGRQVNVPVTVQPKGGYALKEGRDYTVQIDSDYNVGTHFAKVVGMGKYGGTVELAYTISKAKLPKIGTLSDVMFDGTDKTFNIVLKNSNGIVLTEGVDYTLHYYNNNSVGEAKVLAVACENGNYTGESEAVFNILPQPKPAEPEKKNDEKKNEENINDEKKKDEPAPEDETQTAVIRVDGTAPARDTKVIMIDSNGNKFDAQMNGGLFNADVPSGKYEVWITCEGYCPRKCEITVGSTPAEINTDIYRFGDVDMSDEIDIADAVAVINNINGVSALGEEQANIGDVNLDGQVDIADAVAVINNINGTSAISVDNERAIDLYVKSFNSAPDEEIADEDIADEETTSDEDAMTADTESDTEEHRYSGEDGKVYVICNKKNEITIKVYADESASEPEKQYIYSKDDSMENAPEGYEKTDEAFINELMSKLTKIS